MLQTSFDRVQQNRRLRVARMGRGPALIFLHGYPDNLQIWCELAPLLSDGFEVIAFDWPGMGYSDPWTGGVTPIHMADRLLSLLDHWGIERAGLVGMDMGGQPALAFAARYPERTHSVVVMNSLLFGDEDTSWEIDLLRKFGWNRFILQRLPRPVFQRAMWTFLPSGIKLPNQLREDLWVSFRRAEVRSFIAKMCAGYQGTLSRLPDLYSQIVSPTLILWGERDKHFPPVHARRLEKTVPGARLHVIPEAEHWMAWYLANQVADQIRDFLI
jgi:pimeloyl-ACP methyl ester carboxylesterase